MWNSRPNKLQEVILGPFIYVVIFTYSYMNYEKLETQLVFAIFFILYFKMFKILKYIFEQGSHQTGKCQYEINFSGRSRVAQVSSTYTSLRESVTQNSLFNFIATIFFFCFVIATVGVFGSWKKNLFQVFYSFTKICEDFLSLICYLSVVFIILETICE